MLGPIYRLGLILTIILGMQIAGVATRSFAQVGHKCVAYCDGDPSPRGGGGGGWSAPSAPSGPSAASMATSINNRAVELTKKKNYAGAIPLLRQAVQLDPSNEMARRNLIKTQGLLLSQRGNSALLSKDYDQALRLYREALGFTPHDQQLRANMAGAQGHIATRTNNWTQAIEYFHQEMKIRKRRDQLTLGNIAQCEANIAIERGNYALAVEKIRKANDMYPTSDRQSLIKTYENKLAEQRNAANREAEQAQRVQAQRQEEEKRRADESRARDFERQAQQLKETREELAKLKDAVADRAVDREPRPTTTQILPQINVDSPRNTNLFGQEAGPRDPQLDPRPTGPAGSGPSAAAQADSARQTAATGATMDGSRGNVPSDAVVPVFRKTPTEAPERFRIPGWTDERMARLEGTPRGRQIVEDDKKLRDTLKQSNDKISEIKSKLGAAPDSERQTLMEQWTSELNAQPEINKKLTDLEREAGTLIVELR